MSADDKDMAVGGPVTAMSASGGSTEPQLAGQQRAQSVVTDGAQQQPAESGGMDGAQQPQSVATDAVDHAAVQLAGFRNFPRQPSETEMVPFERPETEGPRVVKRANQVLKWYRNVLDGDLSDPEKAFPVAWEIDLTPNCKSLPY